MVRDIPVDGKDAAVKARVPPLPRLFVAPAAQVKDHGPAGCLEMLRDGAADKSMIGGFTFEADGALLLFMNRGMIKRWSGKDSETILEVHPDILSVCARWMHCNVKRQEKKE